VVAGGGLRRRAGAGGARSVPMGTGFSRAPGLLGCRRLAFCSG
jgi:hypothetical protein